MTFSIQLQVSESSSSESSDSESEVYSESMSENSDDDYVLPSRKAKKIENVEAEYVVDSESEWELLNSDDDYVLPSKKTKNIENVEAEYIANSESEWQSDWSSEKSDEDLLQRALYEDAKINDTNSKSPPPDGSSSSDDENSEKCPICLLKLSKQEVATPENCIHNFCFECLQEWSKNVSTCPIDRKEFKVMLVRKRFSATQIREVKVVAKKKTEEIEVIEDDTTFCEVCRQGDREDIMLLCDGCDCGFHMDCLTPILVEVPAGDWFCPTCAILQNRVLDSHNTDNVRRIPRTMLGERVRHNVESQRCTRQYSLINIFDHDQPSTSSGFFSNGVIVIEDSPRKTPKKRVTTRKKRTVKKKRRKVTRRRKYKIEYEICQKTGEKVKVKKLISTKRKSTKRKTKRKTKGKSTRRRRKTASPEKKSSSSKRSEKQTEVVQSSANSLHLFGRRNELDYFSDDSEEEPIPKEKPKPKPHTLVSHSLNKTVSTPKSKPRIITPASSSTDLLDSIMKSQEQWHSKKTSFELSGGKLVVKNKN